jgi:hypothetical protein
VKRADIEKACRDAAECDAKIAGLTYSEKLTADGWRIEVDTHGLPRYMPRVRVCEARGKVVGLDELTALQTARVSHVKAEIEAWWEGKGDWPIAPPPDRRLL